MGVRTNNPGILEEIRRYLPPGWKASNKPEVQQLYSLRVAAAATRTGARQFNLLYSGATRLVRSLDLTEALDVLEGDLQLYVAAHARRKVFIHAGVVGWQGQAILLPGKSHAGKTTLVAELVRAGAVYYSDEYAVVDENGRVFPYGKPLSVRGDAEERPRRVQAAELGGTTGGRALPVGLVAVLEYRAGSLWRPRRLSPGQAALALLENTVCARRRPEASLRTLRLIVAHTPVLQGSRGEAADTAVAILSQMRDAPPPGA